MKLTEYSQELLDGRTNIGKGAILLANNGRTVAHPEDSELLASDVIADVLTAMFGPAGTASYEGGIVRDSEALSKAQDLLWHAFDSYRGDAEDYEREEPEPCDTPPGTHTYPERCLGQNRA